MERCVSNPEPSKGRNQVYQSMTETLTRKVNDSVGKITRYVLLTKEKGEHYIITGYTIPNIPGVINIFSRSGRTAMLTASLKYSGDRTGLIEGISLKTKDGRKVSYIGEIYGEIMEVGNCEYARSSIDYTTGEVETLPELWTTDGRKVKRINGYKNPGILQVEEETMVYTIIGESGEWLRSSYQLSGNIFYVQDILSSDGKMIPVEYTESTPIKEKEEQVLSTDDEVIEDITWFSGLPGGVGVIYNKKEQYKWEGREVHITRIQKDGKYELGNPLLGTDNKIIKNAYKEDNFPFIRINGCTWTKGELDKDGKVEIIPNLITTEGDIIHGVFDEEDFGYYAFRLVGDIRAGKKVFLYITHVSHDGICTILKTKSGETVRNITNENLPKGIYRLETANGILMARLVDKKWRELSRIDSTILQEITEGSFEYNWSHHKYKANMETGEISKKK